jgi:glycosyltransferase involved in cell wall biosynthesis
MNVRPLPVTIVCATRDACDAVRLTVRSLLRHTPPVGRIVVADNGSTDGTLEWLRTVDGIDVVALDERARVLADEHEWRRSVAAALVRRGAGSTATARRLLGDGAAAPVPSTEHGATLDWLVAHATTPYVVTLDSDVELLADGWLEAALAVMHRDGLAAFGSLEPGRGQYRPRLALHLLLIRTDAVRRVNGTFRGTFRCDDPDERERWRARRTGWAIDLDDLDAFPGVIVYPPGAQLLEALDAAGERWAAFPADIEQRYVHYGHLSWGGADGGHRARRAAVRDRLVAYEPA